MTLERKCQNSKCNKTFEVGLKNKNKKYCCKKCQNDASGKRYRTKKSKLSCTQTARPHTELTVYLVHKWSQEGTSIRLIADLLDRKAEEIADILNLSISVAMQQSINKYFATNQKSINCRMKEKSKLPSTKT